MTKNKLLIILLSIILITGCNNPKIDMVENSSETTNYENSENLENSTEFLDLEDETVEDEKDEADLESYLEKIDLSLKPNEAGKVMILMYHSIGEKDNDWEITPNSFREDLEYLYKNNYRPIALKDFVKGDIDTPAGYTPVVLTFDDANQNNFNIIEENGKKIIDPESAVGIMDEFNKRYEDFNITATFYVFGNNPFRQKDLVEYKLKYLVENGYDVGNHTYGHAYLNKLTKPEEIQEEMGKLNNFLKDYLPGYEVDTFAIPYGINPSDELRDYIFTGEYEGIQYNHIAALEVGWYPSHSSYDHRFDAKSIPRIRASKTREDSESEEWFLYFEQKPHLRYVSDGFKDIVTIPKDMEELINMDFLGDKIIYIYEE
jgi:peptidoglycan/xylan/chitin deacetylase (PgdA/CDA1 family)